MIIFLGSDFVNLLKNCVICPRRCGVNRYQEHGFCGADNIVKVSYYSLHMWEEPVLSGKKGSGTIFFSHCNLRCLYCQNKKISIDESLYNESKIYHDIIKETIMPAFCCISKNDIIELQIPLSKNECGKEPVTYIKSLNK